MAEVMVAVPADKLDTLIRAQCEWAARMLSGTAEEILDYSQGADLADPVKLEPVANAIRFVREDLDALAALGIGEAS